MTVRIDGSLEGIDWAQAKADLAADDFDNGRSPVPDTGRPPDLATLTPAELQRTRRTRQPAEY